jgi:hypothetical protein
MLTSQWPPPCSTTSCVQARLSGAYTEVRNSNDPDGPRVWIPAGEWHQLLDAIRTDQPVLPRIEVDHDGRVVLSRVTEIEFTRAEWDAFVVGVRDGDFDEQHTETETVNV